MKEMQKRICNRCGKTIEVKKEIAREDFFEVKKTWGYFSNKDGETHGFTLCEVCYDQWLSNFKIPVEITEENELI